MQVTVEQLMNFLYNQLLEGNITSQTKINVPSDTNWGLDDPANSIVLSQDSITREVCVFLERL